MSSSDVDAQPNAATLSPRGPVVSFSLESSSGGRTALSSRRGKVVVLFYEDRGHTEDNQELKGLLTRFTRDNELAQQVSVLPIANVSSYDFRPASDFARNAIRTMARRIDTVLLMDWSGALQRPPLSLSSNASNVVVIDRTGRLLWKHAGRVEGATRTAFFRALRRAIRDHDGDGEPDAPAPR